MIRISIQFGISVVYLYAIDFIDLLGDSCFTLSIISRPAFQKNFICLYSFC